MGDGASGVNELVKGELRRSIHKSRAVSGEGCKRAAEEWCGQENVEHLVIWTGYNF